jgi:uncharacterized membrane protein
VPSVAAAAAPGKEQGTSSEVSGLGENLAGMLAYFILPAIVFLLVPPFRGNRFVRFHSLQCLLTAVVLIVLQVALVLFGKIMPLLVLAMYGLVILAELALWLLLLLKAYRHEMFRLPLLGNIAERFSA